MLGFKKKNMRIEIVIYIFIRAMGFVPLPRTTRLNDFRHGRKRKNFTKN